MSQSAHSTKNENYFKPKIEQDMAQLYQICDELRENQTSLEVECHDHFQELRRQIDIRREEAKARIDDLYMEMIDLAKMTESHWTGWTT